MTLQEIVARSREKLAAKQRRVPLSRLQAGAQAQPAALDLAAALEGKGIRIIAEVKKASPSRGVIRADFDPVAIAAAYAAGGAAAVSVLTEPHYFQGSLDYLTAIKKVTHGRGIPLLRKDFIYDPYQVYEARAHGADSLLLIAALLEAPELEELLGISHRLGMQCLVEVHNESEVTAAVSSGARIIGINNRDLNTFTVDLTTTGRLRPLIPPDRIVVSESGIKDRDDLAQLKDWGVAAALIGEALVSAPDIAARLKELT